jgi:hypothetical protein
MGSTEAVAANQRCGFEKIRIMLGSWIRILIGGKSFIRISMQVKSRIRVRINVKIQKPWRLKIIFTV